MPLTKTVSDLMHKLPANLVPKDLLVSLRAYKCDKDWSVEYSEADALNNDAVLATITPLPINVTNSIFFVIRVMSTEELEKSFKELFCIRDDELDAVAMFWDAILRSLKLWNSGRGEYLAPLLALIQASGGGKSKTIKEIHFRGLANVLYVCCRNKDVFGFPPRSSFYDVFENDFKATYDESSASALCLAFIISLFTAFETLFAEQGRPDDAVPLDATNQTKFDQYFIVAYRKNNLVMFDFNSLGSKDHPLLLVFDEARALINLKNRSGHDAFTMLRRALYTTKFIVQSPCFLTVVTDTLSSFSNMASSPAGTPRHVTSRDEVINVAEKLLPPFYLITNHCVLTHATFKPNKVDEVVRNENNNQLFVNLLTDPYRHAKLLTVGRPLWGATFNSRLSYYFCSNVPLEKATKLAGDDVLSMAEMKLTSTIAIDAFRNDNDKSYLASVACFGVLLGIRINGDKPPAKSLVASHGAWLKFVSNNAKWLQLGYVSEHALVEAALFMQADYMPQMIDALQKALYEQFVDAGTKAEWIAAQLLLSARHAASIRTDEGHYDSDFLRGKVVGSSVSLYSFLRELGVQGIEKQSENLKSLFINFTHFIQIVSVPDTVMMKKALVYGEAFILMPGQAGADLGIVYHDVHGKIGIMFLQVKNFGQNTSDEAYSLVVTGKLSLSYIYLSQLPTSDMIRASPNRVRVQNLRNLVNELQLNASVPYIGIYIQFGPGNRTSMTRDLNLLSDASLRACLMLHDEDALPCLKMYANPSALNMKEVFLQMAMNHSTLRVWRPDNISEEKMRTVLKHYYLVSFGNENASVKMLEYRSV